MTHDYLSEFSAAAPRPLNTPCQDGARCRLAFVLVPGFTYIGFACAIEPLRMANMAAGEARFAAVTVSLDGAAVSASNGVVTAVDYACKALPAVDVVFVCGPNPIVFPDERALGQWLRGLARRGTALGGIDTGSFLLARAGLLDGYRCTIHWQDLESLLSAFPQIVASNHLYEIDRDRLTSGGGVAAMDLMLAYVARWDAGDDVAAAAADLLVLDRMRAERERQRIPLRQRFGTAKPKLRDAVSIMEANLQAPLALPEIAACAGLSERQLERLYRAHLGCTPGDYYMELRLNAARRQLLYSEAPITEIAHSAGFCSASYFGQRYKRLFGVKPSEERRRV